MAEYSICQPHLEKKLTGSMVTTLRVFPHHWGYNHFLSHQCH